jgi:hypothetical protein
MDGYQFDRLTRKLATTNRRHLLKGLLGIGGATLAAATLREETAGRTTGSRPAIPTPRPPCPRKTCADYPGQCGAGLADGCGGTLDCGSVCPVDHVCASDGVSCTNINPTPECAGIDRCEDHTSCGPASHCISTIEGGGICIGSGSFFEPCTSTSECAPGQVCAQACYPEGEFLCLRYRLGG